MSIAMSPEYLLYYFPLLASVSLVIAATRHERTGPIVRHATSQALWFTFFMMVVAFLLWLATFLIG